jgi:hypothetical protein
MIILLVAVTLLDFLEIFLGDFSLFYNAHVIGISKTGSMIVFIVERRSVFANVETNPKSKTID